eukprot:m.53458 g.53458  ORF g.53458 m.53458 type:complete len:792 (+) comp12384_c0_seq2:101-2476(+)
MLLRPLLTRRQSRYVIFAFVGCWVLLLYAFVSHSGGDDSDDGSDFVTPPGAVVDQRVQHHQGQRADADKVWQAAGQHRQAQLRRRRRRGPPLGLLQRHGRPRLSDNVAGEVLPDPDDVHAREERERSEREQEQHEAQQGRQEDLEVDRRDTDEHEADAVNPRYQEAVHDGNNEVDNQEADTDADADRAVDADKDPDGAGAPDGYDAADNAEQAWQEEQDAQQAGDPGGDEWEDEQEGQNQYGDGQDGGQDQDTADARAANTQLVYDGVSPTQMHGRIGLRPNGSPAFELKSRPKKQAGPAELRDNGFYADLSDSIDLDREVPDSRFAECRSVKYDLDTLPDTSVIFVFHNEHMSTLLRSIHSVLNRSPPDLIREIILVDDGSVKPWLGAELEEQINYLPKVRLLRMETRSGLVKARLRGAEAAKGQTFTVLDSHIEVQPGWLEPLMFRISQGREHVVMPIIDTIQARTFRPEPHGIGRTLGFLWNLWEHGISPQQVHEEQRSSVVDPVPSPTHAGGLFSITRAFFWELGGYDPDFGFWGAENVEFSFRIWQCGGRLECMPCSRVYHIFRDGGKPYRSPANHLTKNRLRTAAIWTDEFEFIVRDALGLGADGPGFDIGPLDHMRELRKKLDCRPFRWFLSEVYPENFLTSLDDILAYGNVQNAGSQVCLSAPRASKNAAVTTGPCPPADEYTSGWMVLKTTGVRPIADLELCVNGKLKLMMCEYNEDRTRFEHTDEGFLVHEATSKCLRTDQAGALHLGACEGDYAVWTLDRSRVDTEQARFEQRNQAAGIE